MTRIVGFDDYYFDENLNIISKKKGKTHMLKLQKRGQGYIYISLMIGEKVYTRRVHRLIAQTFIPNPNNKPQVNHINGVKDDNRVENLEWCTAKENIVHAYKNKLMVRFKGEAVNTAKLTESDVLEIRCLLKEGLSMAKISKAYGVLPSAIFDIKHKISWKHVE